MVIEREIKTGKKMVVKYINGKKKKERKREWNKKRKKKKEWKREGEKETRKEIGVIGKWEI